MIATEYPEKLRGTLRNLKVENHLQEEYEFKYHRLTSQRLRNVVFEVLSREDFKVWAIIVDKFALPDYFRFMSGLDFYMYFLTELIQMIPREDQENAILILDEFGGKNNIAASIRKALKIRDLKSPFKRIVAKQSQVEPLIQVADLMAGAISHRDTINNSEDFDKVQKKIVKTLEYP